MKTINRIKKITALLHAPCSKPETPGFSSQDLISIALDATRNSQLSGVRRAS